MLARPVLLLTLLTTASAHAEDQPLSAAEVKKTVESRLGDIKACIGKEAPGGPTGKVVIHYFILPTGKVDKPGVQETSTANAKLDRCLVEVFRGLQFTPPRGGVTMEQLYPLQFAAPPAKKPGDLTPEQVAGAIKPHLDEVKACYQAALKADKPTLSARVIVEITVNPAGEVAGSRVVKSDSGFAAGEACLLAALKKWHFPKPTGGGDAVIPDFPFVIKLEAKK